MEQKDDFERFMDDHRADFESERPDPRVWSRLEAALDSDKKAVIQPAAGKFFTHTKRWFTAAAVLLLCISLAAFVRTYQVETMADRAIPGDLRDAQAYYDHRISLEVARIKTLSAGRGEDSAVWETFTRPDEEYDRVIKALKENPGEPHVRAAFVEFYRSRLQVLVRIEKHLEARDESLAEPGQ